MAENIKAIIIDDEPKAVKLLNELLGDFEDINVVAQTTKPTEALDIITQCQPQLLFLDIQMPVMDGFEVVEQLKSLTQKPEIIFTTSYEQYAIKAIRTAAFDYLMKPIDNGQLKQAIDRYKKQKPSNNKGFDSKLQQLLQLVEDQKPLKFHTRDGILYIRQEDIIACEAKSNYTRVILKDGTEETLTTNLGAIRRQLTLPCLLHAGRSAIINKNHIHKLSRRSKACLLKCGNQEYKVKVPGAVIKHIDSLL